MESCYSDTMSGVKRSSSSLRVSPQAVLKIGKAEHTRAAILNAALDFLWSHPFRDMTVSSVTDPAGVGRSAFYQYFKDLHELMETLLDTVRGEILAVTGPWFTGVGDPVVLLNESLGGLVEVCYHRGPILRAIDDAASTDKQLEKAWTQIFDQFNDAVTARIEADQGQGLIPDFAARPVAIALNHLDASTLIDAFGQRPRRKREPVLEALARIWISTLYGSEWLGKGSSNLVRE
jgi:AcrR family transcriptional regulator